MKLGWLRGPLGVETVTDSSAVRNPMDKSRGLRNG